MRYGKHLTREQKRLLRAYIRNGLLFFVILFLCLTVDGWVELILRLWG